MYVCVCMHACMCVHVRVQHTSLLYVCVLVCMYALMHVCVYLWNSMCMRRGPNLVNAANSKMKALDCKTFWI